MKNAIIAAIVAAVVSVSVGAAATDGPLPGKQHFANFGPFCIAKGPNWLARGGVMRAVRTGQKCFPGERRIFHKRIPIGSSIRITGKQGATGLTGPSGAIGATGPAGPSGSNGSNGSNGSSGTPGSKGDTGTPGANGSNGSIGPAGPIGLTGPMGATGTTGPQGPAGKDGTNGTNGTNGKDGAGLGNGTIQVCVSNGGSLQMDVNGQPCDNQGHTPITLVVVNSD